MTRNTALRMCAYAMPVLLVVAATTLTVSGQRGGPDNRREKFRPVGGIEEEARASDVENRRRLATEAPTGFDNRTNGFTPQGPPYDSITEDDVLPLRSFTTTASFLRRSSTSRTASARRTTLRVAAIAIRTL